VKAGSTYYPMVNHPYLVTDENVAKQQCAHDGDDEIARQEPKINGSFVDHDFNQYTGRFACPPEFPHEAREAITYGVQNGMVECSYRVTCN
jgi:hypothetical protein